MGSYGIGQRVMYMSIGAAWLMCFCRFFIQSNSNLKRGISLFHHSTGLTVSHNYPTMPPRGLTSNYVVTPWDIKWAAAVLNTRTEQFVRDLMMRAPESPMEFVYLSNGIPIEATNWIPRANEIGRLIDDNGLRVLPNDIVFPFISSVLDNMCAKVNNNLAETSLSDRRQLLVRCAGILWRLYNRFLVFVRFIDLSNPILVLTPGVVAGVDPDGLELWKIVNSALEGRIEYKDPPDSDFTDRDANDKLTLKCFFISSMIEQLYPGSPDESLRANILKYTADSQFTAPKISLECRGYDYYIPTGPHDGEIGRGKLVVVTPIINNSEHNRQVTTFQERQVDSDDTDYVRERAETRDAHRTPDARPLQHLLLPPMNSRPPTTLRAPEQRQVSVMTISSNESTYGSDIDDTDPQVNNSMSPSVRPASDLSVPRPAVNNSMSPSVRPTSDMSVPRSARGSKSSVRSKTSVVSIASTAAPDPKTPTPVPSTQSPASSAVSKRGRPKSNKTSESVSSSSIPLALQYSHLNAKKRVTEESDDADTEDNEEAKRPNKKQISEVQRRRIVPVRTQGSTDDDEDLTIDEWVQTKNTKEQTASKQNPPKQPKMRQVRQAPSSTSNSSFD